MKLRNKLTGLALGLVSAIAPSQEYNWKDVEIITPEEATQRYGEAQLPLNVYSSFDDFIQETEYNTQPLRVSVGEGEYKSNISKSVIIDYPIILSGNSKDKPKIKTTIAANDYLETDNISFDGDTSQRASSLFIRNGGRISYCDFTNYSALAINSSEYFEITDNTFIDTKFELALGLMDVDKSSNDTQGIIRRNTFKNIEEAIYTNLKADIGGTDNFGENIFENVGTAIINTSKGELNMIGNYFADQTAITKSGEEWIVYTEPQTILEEKVINAEGSTTNVSGTLWRPLPYGDYNDDLKINSIDLQECINQVLGYTPLLEPADINKDGNLDALDVQATINKVLGIDK